MDRRGRSPPRRRGPYDGPSGMMDRRRSRSPPDRFNRGRSPPPFNKRPRRDDEPYYGRFNRDDGYDRPPRPPPRGYSGPYDGRRSPSPGRDGPDRGGKLMTFKQFMLTLDDDPSPEEAQHRYKLYLIDFHGSEIKAEFEQTKNQDRVRALFDPRAFEKALTKRNEEAADSRARFFEDVAAGALDPAGTGFNQGALELAPKPAEKPAGDAGQGEEQPEGPATAPAFCWQPARVASDLVLARRLARRLDFEKGFTGVNELLPAVSEQALAAQAEADAQEAQAAAAAKEEGKVLSADAKQFVAVEEVTPAVDASNYDEHVGKLDLLLTYLWRVHGVDFYSGYELNASEFPQRLSACRLLRGPRPEDVFAAGTSKPAGQAAAAAAEGGDAAAVAESGPAAEGGEAEGVEACWNQRIKAGDPLVAKCQRAKVESLLDQWIESQVVCHSETKWGSQLSSKLFQAKRFVLKHVHTKHQERLQQERDKILDDLYFENFKQAKEEEHAAHDAHGHEGHDMEGVEEEEEGGFGGRGGRGGRGGGRGRGRMGMLPGMMMDPMAMMGPMMMPGPGGPMPFLPMMPPPGMPLPMLPPPLMMGMMRGRGGRMGGRGMGGRGRGVPLNAAGTREYFDLDNPQNNRAILDYGDL